MGGDVGGASKTKSEPNVVPLCDILLVLLIIFMVVTPMIKKGANVKLPEAINTMDQPEPGNMITIFVQKDGSVYLDETKIDNLEELPTKIEDLLELKKQSERTKLLFRADNEVTYGRVAEVMDQLRRAQIEVLGLVTADKVSNE